MAKVKPFKAIRPIKDIVSQVTTRSYDTYSEDEILDIIKTNPNSFLQIIHPFFDKHKFSTIDAKFEAVKDKYTDFKTDKILIQEDTPVYYLYKKTTAFATFIGIIAATSTKDYKKNIIKKHEKTLKKRELLFKNYLKKTGFNAEPVLLTYPDNPIIDSVIKRKQMDTPEYNYISDNGKQHTLWIINNKDDIKIIKKQFKKINSLYIADGHHRSASSYLLSKDLKTKKAKYFLSYLISESNLKISAFNRLINTLNELTEDEFLKKLSKKFIVTKMDTYAFEPEKTHSFSMYLGNHTYLLQLKSQQYTFKNSLHHLDTHILYKNVIKKILGIENVRIDKRISYVGQHYGQEYLKKQVINGNFKVAFGLYPVSVEQMKQISDDNLTMPPKSTYILPKLKSGLIIYEF